MHLASQIFVLSQRAHGCSHPSDITIATEKWIESTSAAGIFSTGLSSSIPGVLKEEKGFADIISKHGKYTYLPVQQALRSCQVEQMIICEVTCGTCSSVCYVLEHDVLTPAHKGFTELYVARDAA